jgi:hypothetical protein
METPSQRPAAIAALEPVAARHRAGGKKDQMANLFALLKAERQTLDFLEGPELDRYARGVTPWAASDTIFLNASVDAFTTAFGPVILTKTLPAELSRIAPQSA